MKIAVLGAGAMGSLFGGYLSRKNEVWLIDVSKTITEAINKNGLRIEEPDGSSGIYNVPCCTDSSSLPVMDLVIVFVKAMYSKSALEANRNLIGTDTALLSLQNGAGHEELLSSFADVSHVLFGTTQHNAAVLAPGVVKHGGSGISHIGRLNGNTEGLDKYVDAFNDSGISCDASDSVNHMVWAKLFTNVSASALTGVLNEKLGFISRDEYARTICEELIKEAVEVAKADGETFDVQHEIDLVMAVCNNSPEGITSICADLRNGRKTEVDTISGSVVKKAKRLGIEAPYHEFIVDLVHAMENRSKQ